jgi:predicted Zn finger-like uncharacterized protein
MIIQCPKCATRYRFDESLIEEAGVWVRCSLCQHVFYQVRPSETMAETDNEIPSIRISDSKRVSEDSLPSKTSSSEQPDSYSRVLDASPADNNKPPADLASDLMPVDDEENEPEKKDEQPLKQPKKRRRWLKALFEVVAVLIFVAVVAGAVFLYLCPDLRKQVLQAVPFPSKAIPFLEKVIPEPTKQKPEINSNADRPSEDLLIKDLRFRAAPNIIMGNLQVIEGTVVNQTSSPIAKIQMRLVITDAYDVVLGDKFVYCGNILTDEELGTLTETEIQRELSKPEGRNISNEHIAPNGIIPFMMLYKQDKKDLFKASVTVAGFERLTQ